MTVTKTKTKTYLFHEISSYLPLLEGEEFDALVDDIKQFGQIEPAILFEGKILDGRNRYRACKKIGLELKVREWTPSELTGMTPLQFVISENIMRRHLNTAQKSEIGLLLLEEEEKLTQKRVEKMQEEKIELMRLEKEAKEEKDENLNIAIAESRRKIENLSKGSSTKIVGEKVKISKDSLERAKKIKEAAKGDKEVAEDWEKAKKGDIGVSTVYDKVKEKEFVKSLEETEPEVRKAIEDKVITPKEAKEVITLPKELKQAVIKPEAKLTIKEAKEASTLPEDVITEVAKEEITIKDAKDIAEIPEKDLRKRAIDVAKKITREKDITVEYMRDVGTGKTKPETKVIDLDMKIINQYTQIYKQVIMKMTIRLANSYPEQTKVRLIKIMRETLIHLQKELKMTGEIIDAEAIQKK